MARSTVRGKQFILLPFPATPSCFGYSGVGVCRSVTCDNEFEIERAGLSVGFQQNFEMRQLESLSISD